MTTESPPPPEPPPRALLPPLRIGPAHPLALVLVALVCGAGFFAFALRWSDGVSDGIYHLAFAIQLALMPPLYGMAHNGDRPIWKGVLLLAFGTLTWGVGLVYADLVPPTEIRVQGGWGIRPAAPEYYLPPVMFALAWLLMMGHWVWSAVRRRRR
jgi:hypothetical protein